ncbi:MAG: ribbon-helix-helix domain-containing protein [Rhodobacteraceae bacterium]|nr:ribbon-helix-helix domain-containing protein [Paracoccaceae bacterium]
MSGERSRKRSLTLRGHGTNVSLKDDFWNAFRQIAAGQGKQVNVLAAEIGEIGLASAMRLYVVHHLHAHLRD